MTVVRRLRVVTLDVLALTLLCSVPALRPPVAAGDEPDSAEVALSWQATALATVPFTPAKSLYLAFTSRAVDRAVQRSLKAGGSSETAAVAQAAHDVLMAYFPGASATLDARLA